MVRLLIKRLFGEICPREAYIEEINAWVDCDKDRTIGENLMQLSEKYMIYKQRVRDGQMGITPQLLDDIPGSYGEAASILYCSAKG